ncbi:Rha family transcriptional regulator [Salmonella enterica]|nr:Rha family transcriptional regulator [Salmonella enterica]EDT1464102.1 Rha family transcriptional regulator [Salmonella enterica subsp. enterica serovar Braenderup]EAZ8249487.1 Rha family transcriptional regulator [Salmonella enterica]EAZ8717081.1 Rha family transcriptional regulator [Salmonella enterica]EAZ9090129.1 Rha family transcriptional regulator [Salmonella enterica]
MNTAIATTNTASLSLVVDNTKPLTMSSREIAEYTGKRHDNVVRDIRNMLNALGEDVLKFEGIYLDQYGREKIEFHLNEELTMTLVTGYNVVMRNTVIKEWQRLKEEREKANNTPVNPFADFEETDWIELALEKTRENKKLIELHVRKSVDAHSMTRLLGEKRGSLLVQKALNALREAGYIERVYDDSNKPKGYIANDNSLTFCRMNAHFQLEFTVDVLPVLVDLGVLEAEQKETLRLPQPNNTLLIQNKAAQKIRESANSLTLVGFGI